MSLALRDASYESQTSRSHPWVGPAAPVLQPSARELLKPRNLKVMAEPAWLKDVAPDSCVTYRDLVAMFGFASKQKMYDAVSNGSFPKSDLLLRGRAYWKVATIRKEFRRRQKLAMS